MILTATAVDRTGVIKRWLLCRGPWRSFDVDLRTSRIAAPPHPMARVKHWQTVFIVLAGISVLAVALTMRPGKKTDPRSNCRRTRAVCQSSRSARQAVLGRKPRQIAVNDRRRTSDRQYGTAAERCWVATAIMHVNGGAPPPGTA
jgi:hypothetical protein